MIQSGDLAKQCEVRIFEGEYRTRWRPWRKQQIWRTVAYGYIHRIEHSSEWGLRMEIHDLHNLSHKHWRDYA